MSTEYCNQYLIHSPRVHVRPQREACYLGREASGSRDIGGYAISFHIGPRELSRHEYSYGEGQFVLEGQFFKKPVRIALLACMDPDPEQRVLRIALAATPTTAAQQAELVAADSDLSDGLWRLPKNRLGFPLGEHWLPAGPDVLQPVPTGPDHIEEMRAFEIACQPFFDRVLYGEPSVEAARLLDQIPGVSGELDAEPN